MVSHYYELASRYNELVARYYELVSRYYELVSRYNELVSRYLEVIFFSFFFKCPYRLSYNYYVTEKRTAQKDITIDTTSDSQVNSNFPSKWSPASLTFNNYFYLFLYLYIT